MPGIAQVWLTQEELDALLRAAGSTNTRVSERMWSNLAPKLKDARDALGCPVPSAFGLSRKERRRCESRQEGDT